MKLAALRRTVDSDAALFLLVVAFSFAYLSLFIFQSPYDLADEGYLYYVVERLLAGDRPYLDVELHSYLPPMFGGFAGFSKLAGNSVTAFRALMAVGLSLSAGLAYLSLKSVAPRRWAVLLALATALVPGPFYKFYVRLLQLGVLAAALWWWRSRSRGAWAVFVAASAAGLLFRVDVFYAGLALGVAMLIAARMRRDLSWATVARLFTAFCAAFVGAVLLVGLWLSDAEVFTRYLGRLLGVVGIAAERTESPLRWSLPSPSSAFSLDADTGNAWMAYGSMAALAVLAVALAFSARRERLGSRTIELALVLGWALLNMPQYLWVRPDPYHATQQAFAFLLAATVALHHLRSERHKRAAPFAAVAVAMLLVGNVALHAQALRWSAGVLRIEVAYVNPCGVPYVAYATDRTSDLIEVACLHSAPDDTLEAIPFATGANHVSARKRPSRHLFILAEDFKSVPAQQQYLDEVAKRPPAFVLYEHASSVSRDAAGLLKSYAPLIDRYYLDNYRPVLGFQGRMLMVRRAERAEGGPETSARALESAKVAFARNDDVAGVGAAIRAMRASPDDLAPLALLGRQAGRRKDVEVAKALWPEAYARAKQAVRDQPERFAALAPLLTEAAVGVGQRYFDERRFGAAEGVFRELAELDPSSAQAELMLGQVLRRSRGCADARPRLERALALDPSLEPARRELAACP
ncbi:MAG: hypothetical protein HYS27_19845 [Deltaproteobacteria bacterium]|nr:hypothetical protein [Deltaproteobacteria bacterium]